MATKLQELKLANAGQGCLGKAKDDEPVFILRAQDEFAPALVQQWADRMENAYAMRVDDGDVVTRARLKIKEARALAHLMRAWQALNIAKLPD